MKTANVLTSSLEKTEIEIGRFDAFDAGNICKKLDFEHSDCQHTSKHLPGKSRDIITLKPGFWDEEFAKKRQVVHTSAHQKLKNISDVARQQKPQMTNTESDTSSTYKDNEDTSSDEDQLGMLAAMLERASHSTAKFSLGDSCPQLFQSSPDDGFTDTQVQHDLHRYNGSVTTQQRTNAANFTDSATSHTKHISKVPFKGSKSCHKHSRHFQRRNSFVIPHTSKEKQNTGPREVGAAFLGLCSVNTGATADSSMPVPPQTCYSDSARLACEGTNAGVFGLSQDESQSLMRRVGESILQQHMIRHK